ncbi:MAG: AbrB/MazE/SpoVT family DNA-binding domain-containing protein [Firmicutes bacterium]|nr:AbrB/MazE/SpoVT family DNA-binding domain-containing protein [Bacillota bacterium]
MNRIILQMDERGRVTIPQSLRKAWRLRPGDYLVIDPERKRIDRAEILTDEELADPAVVEALHKLKAKAEKDLYAGRTKQLDSYVAERKLEE